MKISADAGRFRRGITVECFLIYDATACLVAWHLQVVNRSTVTWDSMASYRTARSTEKKARISVRHWSTTPRHRHATPESWRMATSKGRYHYLLVL